MTPPAGVLPTVTVAVPLWNDAGLLPGLFAALLAQDYPADRLQILLLDGGSSDGAAELARDFAAAQAHATLLSNPRRLAVAALNLALTHATGEVFVRLDARTRPALDYISRGVALLAATGAAGVAGPQIASSHTRRGRAIALALNHPLGVGGARYRQARTPQPSETLYLGIYPVGWLRRVGGWDERFAANEDYDLNTRLRQAGGQLIVDPAIRSAYLARDSLAALARQYARYGAWRTVTWRKHPGAMRLRHLAPAALTAALGLGLLALPLSPWPLLLILSCYLLPLMAVAALLARRHRLTLFPTLLAAFLIIHLAWGLAFWPAWLHPPRANAHR